MVLLPNLKQKMQMDIINGVFKDVMPSIKQLALHYKVGESTMKLSLKQLKEDGFLIGHQGKCIRVNPLATGNHFFKKNIVLFIKLHRLRQPLYSQILEALYMTFETKGAYVHMINSIQQLQACRFDIDILIVTETKDQELQYIIDNYEAEKIILLNGYSNTYSNVGTDNFLAGYEAIRYLHEEKKHNAVGILSIYLDYEVSFNKFRRDGANEYCRQHPEVKLFEVDTENFDSVDAAIENLFSQNQNITAIFATMDQLAFNVYSYAAVRNIEIPSQLAVLGFDNSSFCDFTIPPFSSFAEDADGMTEILLKLTRERLIGNCSIQQHLFPPILAERKSV